MKLEKHPNCPDEYRGHYTFRGPRRRRLQADTAAIYERDTESRTYKRIGQRCRLCRAVKMDGWTAWIAAS